MKQILLTLVLFMIVLSIKVTAQPFSEEIPPSSITETAKFIDTSVTYKKVYENVRNGLSKKAEELQISESHLYKTLIREQIINALVKLLLGITSIFSLLMLAKTKHEDWKDDPNAKNSLCVPGILREICFILSVAILVLFLWNMSDIASGLINPEYKVIKELRKIEWRY